ncbi:hypothetical protein [Flavobacterium sp.]|uniref:hypothetical protein n=1 Tax=Flavobacterium sp. TaxID=239 RepID=UPI0026117EFC|nr:hypothetical protein [Flavobacterium sp.]MDG2433444.1 hypothetical protein [Flavobacterium sp.]
MKKIFTFLKITFGLLITLVLVTLFYLYLSSVSFLESKDQTTIDYLTANKVELNNSTIDTTLFDADFYKSEVFLLGEIHGFAANQIADRQLFLFLNKKIGVKYYIAEMDSITANQLTKYLNNKSLKDATVLKNVVKSVGARIPQQSSAELYTKWSLIYDYNQKLADSLKITVLGIDKNSDDYTTAIRREQAMLLNFQNYMKKLHLNNEKCYGLFGFYHTLQNATTSDNIPFATQLKQTGTKVTTIVSFPIDSEMYLPKNPSYPSPPDEKLTWMNADGPLMLVKGINDLKELSPENTNTIFKINSKKTPYLESQKLITIQSRAFAETINPRAGQNTTSYFQYVLITRNSKALTALE